ncbi:MAG: serine/threonine protein kinase [Oscillatoriales cyanobacterium]|nr:MAG: serine/threonine protein kinase [Oscillatoriales cyanobacterium]
MPLSPLAARAEAVAPAIGSLSDIAAVELTAVALSSKAGGSVHALRAPRLSTSLGETWVQDRYQVIAPLNEAASRASQSRELQVFWAIDRDDHDRPKVLKMVRRDGAARSSRLQRLYCEAQVLMQSLHHPHIPSVAVDGFFQWSTIDRGPLFQVLVMEAIEGESLETYLRRCQRIRLDEAIRWWVELSGTLQAVHQAGWVHGDIKPANLIVRPNGQLALVDFDAALRVGELATASCGSVGYMAPEQRRGDRVGAATDWFALGRTLIHGLTGEHPLDLQVATSEPGGLAWRDRRPDVPEAIAYALDRLMAPNMGDRRMVSPHLPTRYLLNLAQRLSHRPPSLGAIAPQAQAA